MKLSTQLHLVHILGVNGVLSHSAIRLNLNLRFLLVGLSYLWVRRDDRPCLSELTFCRTGSFISRFVVTIPCVLYGGESCEENTLYNKGLFMYTEHSVVPVEIPGPHLFLVSPLFTHIRQWLCGVFPSTGSCFGLRDPALLQKGQIFAKVVCWSLAYCFMH
jgi:hypothetical protein